MKTGKKTIEARVPDTLTTWYANAFAMSSSHGIGVASPTPFLVFQPFFVSLTLPYSMIKGETVKVPTTVFNYLDSCLTVRHNFWLFSWSNDLIFEQIFFTQSHEITTTT